MNNTANQKGIVSILTTVFFSILILIITLSTVAVQTRELRHSTDSDQSIRAYNAAQAALEKTLNDLKESGGTLRGENCKDNPLPPGVTKLDLPDLGTDSELEITCIKIGSASLGNQGYLRQEEATQYNLIGQPDLQSATIEWGPSVGSLDDSNDLPREPNWVKPALIELTVYSIPELSGGVKPSDIVARTVVLKPSSIGGGDVSLNANSGVHQVKCATSCKAKIKDFPTTVGGRAATGHVVRFRPRYSAADFTVAFNNGRGNSLAASTGGVQIDVTARAGDVFRRLVALSPGYGQPLQYGLDYVILSQNSICKDIKFNQDTGRLVGLPLIGVGPNCVDEMDDPPIEAAEDEEVAETPDE